MTVWITPHLVSAVLAVGGELPEAPRLSELATLNLAAQPIEGQPADTRDEAIPSITDGKPFGSGDSWRWHVHGGFGMEFDDTDNQLFLMGGGLTYFMIQDLALVRVELQPAGPLALLQQGAVVTVRRRRCGNPDRDR
jgi:hypothetical protein